LQGETLTPAGLALQSRGLSAHGEATPKEADTTEGLGAMGGWVEELRSVESRPSLCSETGSLEQDSTRTRFGSEGPDLVGTTLGQCD
jgi:hypothetical protein